MQKKFNLIIYILFILSVNLYCDQRTIIYFKHYDDIIINNKNEKLFFDYIYDFIIDNINDDTLYFLECDKNYDLVKESDFDLAKKYVFSNGGFGYIYISAFYDNSTDCKLQTSVYNSNNENIFNQIYDLTDIDKQAIMLDASLFFEENISQIKTNLSYLTVKPIIKKVIKKTTKKKEHNFPYFSISLMTTSLKLYFDQRTTQKIFSFFPVDIIATFYPLKYLELGVFFKMSYDNMVYKYLDVSRGTYSYYSNTFKFGYGFNIGASFFFDKFHYSFGFKMFNYHLYIPESNFKKTGDYRSELFPQVSFYQKLDIKIFKFLSYSVQVSIRSIQEYILSDGFFYSYPFRYDFFVLEVSLLGFTITF